MTDLISLENSRWPNCRINPDRQGLFNAVAMRLTLPGAVARYKAVEAKTGVPWWFIAVVHEREASQSWAANIAQGDRWDQVSRHVPAGRGPFNSWEDAAYDALVNCAPHAARNKDWSPGGALAMLEQYNGLGYYHKGIPSPYIWAGTNQYTKGKYVADGVFDPEAVDRQLGCAGLLITMGVFKGAQPAPTPPKPTPKPIGKPPIAVGGGAAAAALALLHWLGAHPAAVIGGAIVIGVVVALITHALKGDPK